MVGARVPKPVVDRVGFTGQGAGQAILGDDERTFAPASIAVVDRGAVTIPRSDQQSLLQTFPQPHRELGIGFGTGPPGDP